MLTEQEIRDMEEIIRAARDERAEFMKKIYHLVCGFYGVEDINYEKRDFYNNLSRQVFHYLICKYTDLPLKTIGIFTGHDHSTVIHSRHKITGRIQYDIGLRKDIEVLEKYVRRIIDGQEPGC